MALFVRSSSLKGKEQHMASVLDQRQISASISIHGRRVTRSGIVAMSFTCLCQIQRKLRVHYWLFVASREVYSSSHIQIFILLIFRYLDEILYSTVDFFFLSEYIIYWRLRYSSSLFIKDFSSWLTKVSLLQHPFTFLPKANGTFVLTKSYAIWSCPPLL